MSAAICWHIVRSVKQTVAHNWPDIGQRCSLGYITSIVNCLMNRGCDSNDSYHNHILNNMQITFVTIYCYLRLHAICCEIIFSPNKKTKNVKKTPFLSTLIVDFAESYYFRYVHMLNVQQDLCAYVTCSNIISRKAQILIVQYIVFLIIFLTKQTRFFYALRAYIMAEILCLYLPI